MTLTESRLGARPAPGLVEHVNAVELRDELDAVAEFVLVDLAHALVLTRTGGFDRDRGKSVVAALLKLLDGDPREHLPCDPQIGTITLQIEQYLERECGSVGLDIQRGRSRIDQKATGVRMADRRSLLAVMNEALALARTLLEAADEHDDVIVPGYTHLQHAQPTTLGHYFNAHYWSTSRNLSRMVQTFERLNECPLGGAAHSGTSWPLDRDSAAAYLGFTRPIRNARDAGLASMDTAAEVAATLGLVLAGTAKCASDLYYWSSSEVGMVRIHPSLCGTSSMMPQKRNPIVLERIRGLAGDAAGWAASRLGLLHFATSTDADQGYVHNRIPEYCGETAGAIGLLREVIATLEIDADRLESSAGRHWSTASALADELVSAHGMSFRAAHGVVARFIAAHEASGEPDGTVRPDLAEEPLRRHLLERSAELLDARAFVESRTSAGGTSKARRRELALEAAADLDEHSSRINTLAARIEQARARLVRDARALVAEGRRAEADGEDNAR